jgi:hypothetical protein
MTEPKGRSAKVAALTEIGEKRLMISIIIMSGNKIVILKEAGRRPRLLSGSTLILDKIPKQVRDDGVIFDLSIGNLSFLVATPSMTKSGQPGVDKTKCEKKEDLT